MTRLLVFLAVPFFLAPQALAEGPEVVTLGQDDQLNVQCSPATTTLWATETSIETMTVVERETVVEMVTSTVTVTVTSAGPEPASTTTTSSGTQSSTSPESNSTEAGSYRNTLYFTNWGIYGANYQPQQLPADKVSHVLYAFADIGQDGEVKSSDPYADVQKHWPTDSWNEEGNNTYGCVKQLYMLKKKNRHMKVLLSIGGWSYSPKFVAVAANETSRRLFAASATALVADWGLDGIDIDWEYPANATQAADMVKLLRACRHALDRYAAQHAPNYRFAITVAAPAGPEHYKNMDLNAMKSLVDVWNIMAYDYAGGWDNTTGHMANLYNNPHEPAATKFNTDRAVKDYVAAGISPANISLGIPLYGRSFEKTNATVGSLFDGIGPGAREPGVWPYKTLPRPNATELYDDVAKASYSYDKSARELISYDNPKSALKKAAYVRDRGLGGAVFWEASGDRSDENSLVATVAAHLGNLDATRNLLTYPASRYDNIRLGMPGSGVMGNAAS